MSNLEFELLSPSAFLPSSKFDFISLTKKLFSIARPSDSQVYKELVTDEFDSNQIYEQIEMLNREVLERIDVDKVVGTDVTGASAEKQDDESEENSSSYYDADFEETLEEEQFDSNQEYSEMEQDLEEADYFQDTLTETTFAKKKKKSVVDDDFFSLEEMERFADMSERQDIKMANKLVNKTQESDDDEDETDMFSIGKDLANNGFDFDIDDEDDNANDLKYEDFFVAKNETAKAPRKSWRDEMNEENDGDEIDHEFGKDIDNGEIDHESGKDIDNGETEERAPLDLFAESNARPEVENAQLSTFEKSQLKIQKAIATLEAENMAQKEWTMRGEVSSKARPLNSLLEQDLDVDIAVKPAPIITEESTKSLVDIIIQRIKDKAFDDVEPAAVAKDSVYDPNRRWELDDEKSKKSLAEIYEQEYQQKALSETVKSAKTLAVEKEHKEITVLFDSLVQDLDALSNWHYTPKPATLELEVIPNASAAAISMEEVIPANVSNAQLALPREVHDGKMGKSQNELDKTEKNKLRQKAKRKIAGERKEREKAKKVKFGTDSVKVASKGAALKKLMGQKNVTFVVDPRDKKKMGKGKASTIEKGGKIQKEKNVFRPEMLKL